MKNHSIKNKSVRQGGFSLIELSIVLVIIALIVAGIFSGQYLIRSAEIKSTIADLKHYSASFRTFVDHYEGKPGDMSNATRYWPTSTNGDGNGVIDATEATVVWSQLSLADMVEGSYVVGNSQIGVHLPGAKITGAGYYIQTIAPDDTISLVSITSTGADGPSVSPEAAEKLDRILDDGDASTGHVTATGTGCHTAGVYDTATKDTVCILTKKIK